ncbi:sulfotransferase 1C2-like [Ylistrum balloti]|uniref:sulfotransferase 1C2-like n=1 Tax=Ylistrum balloti TaxID=509963 RepID=UPI0029058253|nr:sulfotransferase 1C2-like [Ylistrum balloti]
MADIALYMTDASCPMPEYDGYLLPKFAPLLPSADTQMTSIREFESRDNDILICSYPKTGSNWVYEIVSMLLQGHSAYIKNFKAVGMLEGLELGSLADCVSPRVLSSHVPFRHLPEQHLTKGCKIVHVLRNPKDTMVSSYNHCKNDPRASHTSEDFPGTWDNFLKDQMENKHNIYDGFFKYEKEWETAKRTKAVTSVHTLFYEDLHKDPVREITRLARYLEVAADKGLVQDVADKCSFQKLQNAAVTIKTGGAKIVVNGNNLLFRKGMVGDWKHWFTVKQNEQFNELVDRELKGSTLNFTYEQ